MRLYLHHMLHDLCSFASVLKALELMKITYCVVPPIRIGGHVPLKSLKLAKHWFVAVTFVKYDGYAKNSNLLKS